MRIGRRWAVVALALWTASTGVAHAAERGPEAIVRVEGGLVEGVVADDHRIFQGVPYAAPPVGERRWRPPAPADAWPGVRSAERPGAPCPQRPGASGGVASDDEDCLHLNVTTPVDARPGDRLPVMVWVHGNGSIGSGDVFDATRLAVEGHAVVVTVNYRLGVFGAFGHPDLPGSGTFGLQDQRAAFEWVRRNAAAFGGDPSEVTAVGVSFGATALTGHLMSPRSQGLFDRAVLHSGFGVMDAPAAALFPDLDALDYYGWRSDREVRDLGASVASDLGCGGPDPIDCLRSIPAAELLDHPVGRGDAAQGGQVGTRRGLSNMFQSYAYGNDELPLAPRDAIALGAHARIPLIVGTTAHEHRTFTSIREMLYGETSPDDYRAALSAAFGDDAPAVLAEYPLDDRTHPSVVLSAVFTDRMWAESTLTLAGALAERMPVRFFEFADVHAPAEFPFPPHLPPGAHHNADVSYVFPSPEFEARLRPDQRRLSTAMIAYWASFARSGEPTVAGLPEWPEHSRGGYVQSLAPERIGAVDYAAVHRVRFWRALADGPRAG